MNVICILYLYGHIFIYHYANIDISSIMHNNVYVLDINDPNTARPLRDACLITLRIITRIYEHNGLMADRRASLRNIAAYHNQCSAINDMSIS